MEFESCQTCETCPHVRVLSAKIQEINLSKDGLLDGAVNGELENTVEQIAEYMRVGEVANPNQVALGIHLRQMVADALDEAEMQEASLQYVLDCLTQVCQGPLEMRGTKDERMYTATICASPIATFDSDIEPVVVERQLLN